MIPNSIFRGASEWYLSAASFMDSLLSRQFDIGSTSRIEVILATSYGRKRQENLEEEMFQRIQVGPRLGNFKMQMVSSRPTAVITSPSGLSAATASPTRTKNLERWQYLVAKPSSCFISTVNPHPMRHPASETVPESAAFTTSPRTAAISIPA